MRSTIFIDEKPISLVMNVIKFTTISVEIINGNFCIIYAR